MHRLRGKLTYANVVSTLALILVVAGGSAYAADQLGQETVGTEQLKRGAVTAPKIASAAVTGAKIQDQAVTGEKIDMAELGTVPRAAAATRANNAAAVNGMTADEIERSSKLLCRKDTIRVAGLCFDSELRPKADYLKAAETCARESMELPTPGQAAAFVMREKDPYLMLWTALLYRLEGGFAGTVVGWHERLNELNFGVDRAEIAVHYRCLTRPTN